MNKSYKMEKKSVCLFSEYFRLFSYFLLPCYTVLIQGEFMTHHHPHIVMGQGQIYKDLGSVFISQYPFSVCYHSISVSEIFWSMKHKCPRSGYCGEFREGYAFLFLHSVTHSDAYFLGHTRKVFVMLRIQVCPLAKTNFLYSHLPSQPPNYRLSLRVSIPVSTCRTSTTYCPCRNDIMNARL